MSGSTIAEDALAERYRRFADAEVRGLSPLYERLATECASSAKILAFLQRLPLDRQQPNLFFAAVRHVSGLPAGIRELEDAVARQAASIEEIMRSRTTQTNEPNRCAVLLPALARLPQPLALLEVGASAGLCLLADRYGYDYGGHRIDAPRETRSIAPVFPCAANRMTPVPMELPSIAWRRGLDLNPLSVTSQQEVDWLKTLVWPEQSARLLRLTAAIETARRTPPEVIRGDLLKDAVAAIKSAPRGMTRVVFHTAVLTYVGSQRDRDAFAQAVMETGATWISNEAPGVFPQIAGNVSGPRHADRFLLAIDGQPVAWTGPHGQSIEWFQRI